MCIAHRPEVYLLSPVLGRDYKRVHEDVEILTAAGLLDRNDTGLITTQSK